VWRACEFQFRPTQRAPDRLWAAARVVVFWRISNGGDGSFYHRCQVTQTVRRTGVSMKRLCLGCCEVVEKHINENYNGMAIHYGQDWYCGPVVSVADDIADETLKHLINDRKANDYYAELAAEHCLPADTATPSDNATVLHK